MFCFDEWVHYFLKLDCFERREVWVGEEEVVVGNMGCLLVTIYK